MNVSFYASMPDIQSWLTVHGNGEGARIKLDAPASELAEVLKMTLMAGQLLRVTIEAEEE